MKKIAFLLLAFLLPASYFAQYQVMVSDEGPTDYILSIPGYNQRIPAATMHLRFEYEPDTETLLVRMGSASSSPDYDKIWLPQHDFAFSDMGDYMKNRGVRINRANTFLDQESFLNLSSKTVAASIECEGMTFNGVYDLKSSKRVRKQLDHQMVPLDGKMELDLRFKVEPRATDLELTLRNPIPMHRKGSKGIVDFVADDVTIDIKLERCGSAKELLQTAREYEAMFRVAENKIAEELKYSPNTKKGYKDFFMNMIATFDMDRLENATCDEVRESYSRMMQSLDKINGFSNDDDSGKGGKGGKGEGGTTFNCDVAALDAEVKSTTKTINDLLNDWSLAGDAATKAEKKNAFNATVKAFDAKLNSLPADCKAKLNAKQLKKYEQAKKLMK